MGWSPELFGEKDRLIGFRDSGRREHKAERWGKKYQWIAFHELLARVADNYHLLQQGYVDREDEYGGLHQMPGSREIDPSLPPIQFEQLFGVEGDSETWSSSPVQIPEWPPARIDFRPYGGQMAKFLSDEKSEPNLASVVRIADSCSEDWIVLSADLSQGDPSASKSWLGLQQRFSFDSWFVPKEAGDQVIEEIVALRRSARSEVIDDHGHVNGCYVGEIGWTPRSCYHGQAEPLNTRFGAVELPLTPSSETYWWEGDILDCSISESVFASIPSTFVQSRSSLFLHPAGPCWLDESGAAVFTNLTESHNAGRGFLVRATWLAEFLKANELELIGASWHERRLSQDSFDRGEPNEIVDVFQGCLLYTSPSPRDS